MIYVALGPVGAKVYSEPRRYIADSDEAPYPRQLYVSCTPTYPSHLAIRRVSGAAHIVERDMTSSPLAYLFRLMYRSA